MARTFEKVILAVVIIAIFGISGFVIAGLDNSTTKTNTNNANQISIEQAKTIALGVASGDITEAILTKENGALVYEIEVTNGNSETEILIDPSNGNVLKTETEVEEDDDVEDEGEDVPITGSALEKASAAALEYIGEGRVTDTEVGDEEGYYEIEITLDNGNEVDVHLDENFNVLSTEYE
ncbi:MAG: PepSY domain-containing protein [Nanoarchaeota archaeon]